MGGAILVAAETDHGALTPGSLECVEEARDIVDARGGLVHAVLPGAEVSALAAELARRGADRVTLVEHPALDGFSADGWLAALEPVLKDARPAMILAPDSGAGRAWLPRLSVRWRMPLVTGCSRVTVMGDGYPEIYRVSHGDRRHERLIWARDTLVGCLLMPGVRGVGPGGAGRRAEIDRIVPALDPARLRDRTLATLPPDPDTVDLTDAERIVSGGLGVGGPDGMAQLQALASALGATLGGTRVAADRGWLAEDRFIGSTGKVVAPKLYLAFGVSGAGQHVAGIGGSEVIVAVNTDRTAPLLKMADLGVIGDLHEVVPILLRKLAARAADGAPPAGAPAPAPVALSASGG